MFCNVVTLLNNLWIGEYITENKSNIYQLIYKIFQIDIWLKYVDSDWLASDGLIIRNEITVLHRLNAFFSLHWKKIPTK